MVRRWILTALGKDQPGIVARVTKILYELGCNLEDSAMTRLEGEFTIMLIFSAKGALSQVRLERAFRAIAIRLKLAIHLKALTHAEATPVRGGTPYHISVYGADRPGIVYRVSQLLAHQRVNITDVSTHLSAVPSGTGQAGRTSRPTGKKALPLYLMVLEVELPRRVSPGGLEQQLRKLAKRLGVDVTLRSAGTDVL